MLSAHPPLRRTGIAACLLLALFAATEPAQAKPSQAHRKAATSSHASTTKTRAAAARKPVQQTTRRSRLHASSRASVRQVRYTPTTRSAPATLQPEAPASYATAYQRGYQAGLEAARKQLGADTPVESRGPRDLPSKPVSAPAISETTEIETPDSPPIDQVASLHLNGGGIAPPLRGSLASLERQNTRVEADGLERILDEDDLSSRIQHKLLVPVPVSAALTVNPNLAETHRYCRPWTAHFLADLARAHQAAFHSPLLVSSAVRTVDYQKRLIRINGNAADAEGDIVSPHLTGATIDIAKSGLTRKEIAWMRSHLLALQQADKLDVEEEFAQACFHITVYKSYDDQPQERKTAPSESNGNRRRASQPTSEKPLSRIPADLAAGMLTTPTR